MIAELGTFLLIMAFIAALWQSVIPLAGAMLDDRALAAGASRAALAQLALVVGAFASLTYVHATSDFSVANVVQNSHSAKPLIYKFTGVWGNHEGSMVLWVLILAIFGAALAATAPSRLKTLTLSVQGAVTVAFLAFILFTSNPFSRVLPAAADGMDLNPLLQDPGLIIHPPFLYLGYVGFSVTFAYAVAALIEGRVDAAWARAVRPFALAAWVFLTIGIALGSWWAYYELGWGGFWAWDPVENASFMPWLAGTAFIHSIRVVEKRGTLKVWSVLLAIMAFSLSLVGTFLVRSGILTSIHAFAVDPERGVFILAILAVAIGGSLTLFALRAPKLQAEGAFRPVSREGALIVNNVILAAMTATVFLGTFYPLFIDLAADERLTVGAPYFNIVFAPMTGALLLAMAPGAMLAWKKGDLGGALRSAWPAGAAALAIAVLAAWLTWPKSVLAALMAGLAVWAAGGAFIDLVRRVRLFSEPGAALSRIAMLPRPYLGMTIAHIGIAVVIIGAMGAGVWRVETVRMMTEGDVIAVGGYEARLLSVDTVQGPNYISETARFALERQSRVLDTLEAERRFYPVRGMQTTEAAIRGAALGDFYLTVGEETPGRGWAVRAWFNPLVVWLWIGSGLLALGGVVAALPKPRPRTAPAPVAQGAPA